MHRPSARMSGLFSVPLAAALTLALIPGALSASPPSQVEAAAADSPRPVILLGNSKVTTDIDVDLLRASLADARPAARRDAQDREVPPFTRVNVFGTAAPVWYAALKHRVYDANIEPAAIVVYATLSAMLTADLPNEIQRAVLDQQMGDDEPVLDRLIFHGPRTPELREHLRRVLLPACDAQKEKERPNDKPQPEAMPADSMVPWILGLAAEHDTPIVFVRAPVGPSMRLARDDVSPIREAAFQDLLDAAGAGWIDLSGTFPEAAFGDGIHMGAAGRRRMSFELADRLHDSIFSSPPAPDWPKQTSSQLAHDGPKQTSSQLAHDGPKQTSSLLATEGVVSPDGRRYTIPLPAVPSEEATFIASGLAASSPLRAVRTVLGEPGGPTPRLIAADAGAVLLNADCTPAPTDYALALDPERGTADPNKRWLYPGDTVTFSGDLPTVPEGRWRLTVGASVVPPGRSKTPLDDPDSTLTVRVSAPGWHVTRTVTRASLRLAPVVLDLPEPAARPAQGKAPGQAVDVTLSASPGTSYTVVTSVVFEPWSIVSTRGSPPFDWMVDRPAPTTLVPSTLLSPPARSPGRPAP